MSPAGTDRPIIMSASMVHATLREIAAPGTGKTQTRRLGWHDNKKTGAYHVAQARPSVWQKTRRGDRLWVRESCSDQHPLAIQDGRYSQEGRAGIPGPPGVAYRTVYRAEGEPLQIWHTKDQKHPYWTLDGPADEVDARHPTVCSNYERAGKAIYWTPAIHMPRWASRLTLVVTSVKVERLTEINGIDAIAEGLIDLRREGERWHWDPNATKGYFAPWRAYRALWDSIHGDGSFDDGGEVVAITFKPYLCNIDRMEPAP